jgi:hypothetical protein
MEERAAQSKGSDSGAGADGKFGSDTQRRANAASEELGRGVIGVTAGIHVSTFIYLRWVSSCPG